MHSPLERMQVLYEIAMETDQGENLHATIKRSLQTILRKLNCMAGAVFRERADSRGLFCEEVLCIPRNIHSNVVYQGILAHLPQGVSAEAAEAFRNRLPWSDTGPEGHGHLLDLPNFGLLLLIRGGDALDPELLHALRPIARRLSEVCLACLTRQNLRESEQRMELALRGADLGTWDWNFATGQVTYSDRWLGMLGYAPGEVDPTVLAWECLVHPDDLPSVRAALDRHLRGESDFYAAEHRLRHRSGTWTWVLDKGRVISRDSTGRPLRACGTHLDITERKQAEAYRDKLEAQLRQSQKMEAIGQLAGGVAHDFNNILTAIFGNVELALDDLEKEFPQARSVIEDLRQIEASAHRAAHLTRQLLAFSRRQMIRPEVVSLHATLHELEKMLGRLISENIALRIHCGSEFDAVRIDPGQLEQVIVNLVVNARDAMPEGGNLTLDTRHTVLDEPSAALYRGLQAGSYVQLTVSDTGYGMDQATLDRIFEPFFTTKAVGQGTGLGLSTVYGILEQAGGCITAYSEPRRGTTFRVYLPLAGQDVSASVRVEESAVAPTGTETVMVCEDDRVVRELTAAMLKDAGYTVLVAPTPAAALQLAASTEGPVDLLVTDVIMPDMNGRMLSDAVRSLRPGVRTLFVSGYTANVIANHGVLDTDVDFLEKPYSRSQLRHRVRQAIDRDRPPRPRPEAVPCGSEAGTRWNGPRTGHCG